MDHISIMSSLKKKKKITDNLYWHKICYSKLFHFFPPWVTNVNLVLTRQRAPRTDFLSYLSYTEMSLNCSCTIHASMQHDYQVSWISCPGWQTCPVSFFISKKKKTYLQIPECTNLVSFHINILSCSVYLYHTYPISAYAFVHLGLHSLNTHAIC